MSKVIVTKTDLGLHYAKESVQLSDGTLIEVGRETEVTDAQLKELNDWKGVSVKTEEKSTSSNPPGGTVASGANR